MVLKLPDAGRGYLMAVGVLNPEGVFQDFEAIQTTRKGANALLDEITGGVPGRLIEIPLEHLGYLYEEVAETYKAHNRELPPGYEVIHKQLSSWAKAVSHAHVYNLLDREEIASEPILLRGSDSLLEEQPFLSWRLDVCGRKCCGAFGFSRWRTRCWLGIRIKTRTFCVLGYR